MARQFFVERLWRSVKYEEVYLRAYDSVAEARTSIGRYLDFYNGAASLEACMASRPSLRRLLRRPAPPGTGTQAGYPRTSAKSFTHVFS